MKPCEHREHTPLAETYFFRSFAGEIKVRREVCQRMTVAQGLSLFALAFAILLPSGDPRLRRLLVNPGRQTRHAHGANESIIDGERQSTGNKINLAGPHVHDAVESVGSRGQQVGYRRRRLSRHDRGEGFARGLAPRVERGAVHPITEIRCPPSSSTATAMRIFKFRA
jgi:hypothetical protein